MSLAFSPPSDSLRFADGLWVPATAREDHISYPGDGNDACFQIEDTSYWFQHRKNCILALMRHFPPAGAVYDIGGGNGFMTKAILDFGVDAVLVEPGSGVFNAVNRGLLKVVHSTLQEAEFTPQSLPAAAAFDVIEHIEDDYAFMATLRQLLPPGGRVYFTVPAIRWLWSGADTSAGHFRRYTPRSVRALLAATGFQVECLSGMFSWLILPIFLQRSVLDRLRSYPSATTPRSAGENHRLPTWLLGTVTRIHRLELGRLSRGKTIPIGSSLLCVARRR